MYVHLLTLFYTLLEGRIFERYMYMYVSHDEGATHRRRPACNACRSCLSHGLSPSTTSRMQITHPPSHTTTSSSERWCCHWTLLSHGYFLSSTILFIFTPTTLCNSCQNCCKVLFQACLLLSLHLHRMRLSLTTCINQDVHNIISTFLLRVVEHITSTSIDWSHFTSSLQELARVGDIVAVSEVECLEIRTSFLKTFFFGIFDRIHVACHCRRRRSDERREKGSDRFERGSLVRESHTIVAGMDSHEPTVPCEQ